MMYIDNGYSVDELVKYQWSPTKNKQQYSTETTATTATMVINLHSGNVIQPADRDCTRIDIDRFYTLWGTPFSCQSI